MVPLQEREWGPHSSVGRTWVPALPLTGETLASHLTSLSLSFLILNQRVVRESWQSFLVLNKRVFPPPQVMASGVFGEAL